MNKQSASIEDQIDNICFLIDRINKWLGELQPRIETLEQRVLSINKKTDELDYRTVGPIRVGDSR